MGEVEIQIGFGWETQREKWDIYLLLHLTEINLSPISTLLAATVIQRWEEGILLWYDHIISLLASYAWLT